MYTAPAPICSKNTPTYVPEHPRELPTGEVQVCYNQLNHTTYYKAYYSCYKSWRYVIEYTEDQREDHMEEILDESAANIKNKKEPLQRFWENYQVS